MFTFMLAPFAAGLVIYWSWNNLLSIIQQYVIMKKEGIEPAPDQEPRARPLLRQEE